VLQENVDIVRRSNDAFRRGDWLRCDRIILEEFFLDPAEALGVVGLEQ